jgi:HEAT repeat protein
MREQDVVRLIQEFAARAGSDEFLSVCLALMAGADRNAYVPELRSLTGHAWEPGDSVFDPEKWPDYWVRSWGARGLLHVWDDRATDAIVAGLGDEHWRPAEMCLKVVTRHEVAGAGDGAELLLKHALPRVRIQALRALAVVGDTEHFESVLAAEADEDAGVRQQAHRTVEAMRLRLGLH